MAKDDKCKQNTGKNDASGETVNLFCEEELSTEEEATDAAATPEADLTEAADDTTATEETAETGENKDGDPEAASEESKAAENSEADASDDTRKKKEAKKDKRDEKIAELNDKVLRQQAEFINFRNRTEKEKAQMFEVGAKSVIEKLLPIVDNFERGIAVLTEDEAKTPFADGMQKVYKQMMEELDKLDVAIPAQYMKRAVEILRCGDNSVPEYMIWLQRGNFTGCPPTTFIYGSEETLYACAPSFEEALKKYGVDYEMIVGEGLFHC
jgi:molecular chaperone GrpE